MPSLPSTVKVACFDISVVDWDRKAATAASRWGEFSADEAVMRIDTDRSYYQILDTFLHELGHVIFWVYGLQDEDKEERVVGTMATAWTQIYRDNPQIVSFIAAGPDGSPSSA